MSPVTENESWIVDDGARVIEKKARGEALTPLERAIHALWAFDYCMCNAGDLAQIDDIHPGAQAECAALARDLGLPALGRAMSLSLTELEAKYFELFDGICDEIRSAQRAI